MSFSSWAGKLLDTHTGGQSSELKQKEPQGHEESRRKGGRVLLRERRQPRKATLRVTSTP